MSARRERQLGWVTQEQQMFAGPNPEDWLDAVRRQVCPFCGAGPFVVVATHVSKIHGVDRFQFRDMLGLTYSRSSICDPFHSQACALRPQTVALAKRRAGSNPGPRRLSQAAADRLRKLSVDMAQHHAEDVAERDAAIVRLLEEGRLTYGQIAAEVGVASVQTVAKVAKRHGLSRGAGRPPSRRPVRVCSVEGCGLPHKAHGLCRPHYRRMHR